jgi:hypothetical protein
VTNEGKGENLPVLHCSLCTSLSLEIRTLSRVRLRQPTDDDIETLRSRIGVALPNMESVAVTVRQHALHQATNMKALREEEAKSNIRIVYYIAIIMDS